MAKAIHGDPKIDAEGRVLVKDLIKFARHDMLANLNLETLTHLARYAKPLAEKCVEYIEIRRAQSSRERDLLSKLSTRA